MRKPKRKLSSIEDIFLSCVIDENGCWNWPWASSRHGYGCATVNSKRIVTHRHSYSLANPHEDISDKVICHKCDNVKCCNPGHLFSGKQSDNLYDMRTKKRHFHVITEEQIKEIIRIYDKKKCSTRKLGEHFNISHSTIASIIKREKSIGF